MPSTLKQIFLDNLKLGALAWGGPLSQIEMIHEYAVEKNNYLTAAEFKELLSICQLLPGPEAAEVCIFIGKKLRQTWGGIVAGVGFFLPNFLLLLPISWLYFTFSATSSFVHTLLTGVRPAIIAIMAFMGYKLAYRLLEDGRKRYLIALITLGLSLLTPLDPLLIMIFFGCVYFVWKVKRLPQIKQLHGFLFFLATTVNVGLGVVLFFTIFKIGVFSVGGANTVIPLLYEEFVEKSHLITEQVFLDGIAINEIIPGPLVMMAAFIGYAVLGNVGALLGTIAIALPAFAIILVFGNKLQALTSHPDVKVFLNGILAAVMGILASFLLKLSGSVLITINAWLIFVISLALLIRWRIHPGIIIALGLVASLFPTL
jgi:chromate transporter